ncbi:N-acetylmuramoyl-L-alanine amidase [Kitasatospora acidiphila]|uniref:N-acetylmuramoyl-L-alanine amidase n=1 Tax=Kitasatospora acidiphila TaxID=2567942 RepID=A0A540W984_9ACTN|nr:N-acetylmuramoyl-L-alanine amidase [Kitasatospora acidiphila]TQF05575.1 N-acetylmuramoyl-L-alanine amidase [Kitasatospora acidiphila]
MQFVTRDQWGACPPKSDFTWIDGTRGVKVHYEGTPVPADLAAPDQHGRCAGRMRDLQASHQANTAEGYICVAYSAVVCPHGFVFEGRGVHHLQAANGPGLNSQHYSVCAMLGDSGLTQPTDAQLNGIRDAIEWLQRDGGAGSEIKGHRDGYATDCPGEPLYRWVQAGTPRPGSSAQPTPQPQPAPGPNCPAWPGIYLRDFTADGAVRVWQQRMAERGWQIAVDGQYGPKSAQVCLKFQTEKNLQRDGVVGPETWNATWTSPIT